jgi:Tol biopolymer transport system component
MASVGFVLLACACSGRTSGVSGAPDDAGSARDSAVPLVATDDGGVSDDGALPGNAEDVVSIPPPLDDADAPPSGDAGPGGPWVAFVSNRTGPFGIYLIHDDGTGLTPLVVDSASNLYPSWSPDGAHIAFASTRDSDAGAYALYVVEVASGAVAPLATGLTYAVFPAWSPDGSTIVFQGPSGLYTVAATGGAAARLTEGDFRDNSPCWSPDGTRIYFSSDRGDGGIFDVWSIRPDGGALDQVTLGANVLGGAAVSPDGGTLAFVQAQASGASGATQVVFAAGGATSVFSAMGDSEPAFSPSGATLAVTSTRYAADNPSIVLLGIPGATSPFRLTSGPGADGQAAFQPGH